jgi:hypothetical protein
VSASTENKHVVCGHITIKKYIFAEVLNKDFMFKQVLVPNEQNATVALPAEWFGMEVVVLAYPVSIKQSKEKKPMAWLSGNSKIDNPVCIGENFRKISRDEIYDRKSFH